MVLYSHEANPSSEDLRGNQFGNIKSMTSHFVRVPMTQAYNSQEKLILRTQCSAAVGQVMCSAAERVKDEAQMVSRLVACPKLDVLWPVLEVIEPESCKGKKGNE